MKLKYFAAILFILYVGRISAQISTPPPTISDPEETFENMLTDSNANYYTIAHTIDSIITLANDTADEGEGDFNEEYRHWKDFYRTRSGADGRLKTFNEAVAYFGVNPVDINCSNGPQWKSLGPDLYSYSGQGAGMSNCIWTQPTNDPVNNFPQRMYLGTYQGFWRSDDGGKNWYCPTDNGLSFGSAYTGVIQILANPDNPDEVCINAQMAFGGNVSNGIYFSHDGGITWAQDMSLNSILSALPGAVTYNDVNFPLYAPIQIFMSPNPNHNIYIVANTPGGSNPAYLYEKTNSGWIFLCNLTSGLAQDNLINPLKFVPDLTSSENDCLFLVSNEFPQKIYRFVVGANTSPQQVTLPSPTPYLHLNLSMPTRNELYVLSEFGTININSVPCTSELFIDANLTDYKSLGNTIVKERAINTTETTDPGYNWLGRKLRQFEVSKSKDPTGTYRVMYYSSIDYFSSIDGGQSWSSIGGYHTYDRVHGDIRQMQLNYSTSSNSVGLDDLLFIVNDGGVAVKPNNDNQWEKLNGKNLVLEDYYSINQSEKNVDNIGGGSSHVSYWTTASGQWTFHGVSGDVGKTLYDEHIFPNSIYSNVLYYQSSSGGTWVDNFSSNYGGGTSMTPSGNNPLGSPIAVSQKPVKIYSRTGDLYLGFNDLVSITHDDANNELKWNTIISSVSTLSGYHTGWAINDFDVNTSNTLDVLYLAYTDASVGIETSLLGNSSGRLFQVKKTNTTDNVTDISPTTDYNYVINSVVSNPSNSNEVWIGFGNFYPDHTTSPTSFPPNLQRVFYSCDGGATWVDRSNGLPNVPINKLIYRSGSNDELYAATDFGVYQWQKNYTTHTCSTAGYSDGQWVCFNNGLPHTIVDDISINNCGNKLRASLAGRGLWECDLPVQATTTEVWGNSYNTGDAGDLSMFEDAYSNVNGGVNPVPVKITDHIHHDIRLYGPGTAMLKDATLRFDKGYKLIVGTGVKLDLESCTLESACGCSWNGVIVNGSTCEPQDIDASTGMPTYQGYLYMDGTTIRDAQTAVSLSDRTLADDWGGGGIVQAHSCIFENNKRAVEFLKYPKDVTDGCFHGYHKPTLGNKSYFSNTTFHNTQALNDGMGFQEFISMWEVNQVQILGCTFENQTGFINSVLNPGGVQTNTDAWGYGIYTLDANFQIDRYCPLCTSPVMTQFNNLHYGIWSSNASTNTSVSIRNSIYTGNQVGLALYTANNSLLQYNTFNVGSYPIGSQPNLFPPGYGALFNQSSFFTFAQNCFTKTSPSSYFTYGAWYYNTGLPPNTTSSNNFTGFYLGEYAQGVNGGLRFKSNTHANSLNADIYAWDILTNSATAQNGGVFSTQGMSNGLNSFISAGNLFTDGGLNSSYPKRNFNNNVSASSAFYTINYYGRLNITGNEYPHNTSSNVNKTHLGINVLQNTTTPIYNCTGDPHGTIWIYSGGHVIPIPSPIFINNTSPIRSLFHTASQNYFSDITLLNSLIDGGNTANDLKLISIATSSDASDLRATLLSQSPYLSTKVGEAVAAAENVFSHAIQFEILASNPDILSDQKIFDNLSNLSSPMPDWMISELQSYGDSVSSRTALEGDIASNADDMHNAVRFLITSISLDSTGIDHSAIRTWLDSLQEPEADMMIVDDLMGEGQYDDALTQADSIPGHYALDSLQLASMSSYHDLIMYFKGLQTNHVRLDSILTLYRDSQVTAPGQAYDPPLPGSGSGGSGGTSGSSSSGGIDIASHLSLDRPYIHQCRVDSPVSIHYATHDLYLNLRYNGIPGSTVSFSAPGKKIVRQTESTVGLYTPMHVEVLDSPSAAWSYTVTAVVYDAGHGIYDSISIPVDSVSMNDIPAPVNCSISYSFVVDSLLGADGQGNAITHFVGTIINPNSKPLYLLLMPQDSPVMQSITATGTILRANDTTTIQGTFAQIDTEYRTFTFLMAAGDSTADSVCVASMTFDNSIHHHYTIPQKGVSNSASGSGSGGSGSTGGGSSTSTTDTVTHTPIYGSIQTIADYGAGPAALRARSFLRFFYHERYEDLPTPPDETNGYKDKPIHSTNSVKQVDNANNIKVYPNPAENLVVLEYNLSSIAGTATYQIVNEMGQELSTGAMSDGHGLKVVDVKQWAAGVYSYKVTSEKGFTSSGSFVVTHR